MKSGRTIWIVLHCEVVLQLKGWVVDEAVFFAASSLRAAERLIRSVHVDEGSWWRVEHGRIDDVEGVRSRSAYYSDLGKPVPAPPHRQGYRSAIRREKRNVASMVKWLRTAAREGKSKREMANMQESLRWTRKVLGRHR